MWHIHHFRKPISLSNPPGRSHNFSQRSSRPAPLELASTSVTVTDQKPLTVLGPGTVPTVWVTHKTNLEDEEESISVINPESIANTNVAESDNLSQSSGDDDEIETAAALLRNTSAPTVWVKNQSDVEGESEELVSVMVSIPLIIYLLLLSMIILLIYKFRMIQVPWPSLPRLCSPRPWLPENSMREPMLTLHFQLSLLSPFLHFIMKR